MTQNWEEFIDNLNDPGHKFAKDQLKNMIKSAGEDPDPFLRRQSEKLERYLNQLAAGQITKEQIDEYVRDIKEITEMKASDMQLPAKASAERLAKGIEDHIIQGMLPLI
jgi:hypothetical protein